jgi:hypothetical protein
VNAQSLDPSGLRTWCDDINAELEPLLGSFESRYGYPPGENRITASAGAHPPAAAQLGAHPAVARALADFYTVIEELTLPDIGNGYFIHPAQHVLDELTHGGPVDAGEFTAVVFGSDGGGILFAVSLHGTVYRSRAASHDSGFDAVAKNLRGFLDHLHHEITRFIETGEPGRL